MGWLDAYADAASVQHASELVNAKALGDAAKVQGHAGMLAYPEPRDVDLQNLVDWWTRAVESRCASWVACARRAEAPGIDDIPDADVENALPVSCPILIACTSADARFAETGTQSPRAARLSRDRSESAFQFDICASTAVTAAPRSATIACTWACSGTRKRAL